jgi:WXG100 family type VII secretion target
MPLHASPDEIASFSSRMHDRHEELRGLISQVKANEDATTATWSGSFRAEFDRFMERYYQLAAKLNDQLQTTADNVASAGKKFGSTDADNSANLVSRTSSLNI